MIEFVLVWSRDGVYGGLQNGKRKVFRCENVDDVRQKVSFFMERLWLVEFIGCGWRCKWEGQGYVWSKVRELEAYVDDLAVD